MTNFLNSTISMGTAIIMTVAVVIGFFIVDLIGLYYSKHKKR